MDFRDFQSDFNFRRASDRHCLPDYGFSGFVQSLDKNPFLKNQCDSDALDLCKKLSKLGISCDVSIWSRPDPTDFGSRTKTLQGSFGIDQNLSGASSVRQGFLQNESFHDGFGDVSSVSSVFPQNNNLHGVPSAGETRFLGFQDSLNPKLYKEMMGVKNHRDLPPYLRSVSLDNDALKGSMMFEGSRVSQTLGAMKGSRASYPEDTTMTRRYLNEDEPQISRGLPLSLVSIVEIYGSVNLMAKDQIGSRVLQKLVEEGTLHDAKFIFVEIIDHVTELSIDPFGNYLVQKLLDVSDEEQRTLLVSVFTSKPMELVKICLNTYGTRVVQKMIETVTTKQQTTMVKSCLKPGFLALVKDLNGKHVLQSCLQALGPHNNKFVLEAATKHFAQIATHPHGCCVLQCCLDNSVGQQHERLVAEIFKNSLHLAQDPFGNYVVQSLIENQVSASKVLVQFRMHYAELATQKFSSHVIEICLKKYPESRAEIVRELLSVPHFEYLLQDQYANYVIQTALSVTKGAVRKRLVEKVYKFGKLK